MTLPNQESHTSSDSTSKGAPGGYPTKRRPACSRPSDTNPLAHPTPAGWTGCHATASETFATVLKASTCPQDFLSLSLRKFTPSTLQTYFRHIGTFLDYLGTMKGDLESMTLAKLVDFLFSCSAGQTEDRTANICGPRPMLKALSWLQRHAQIPALAPIIQNPPGACLPRIRGPSRSPGGHPDPSNGVSATIPPWTPFISSWEGCCWLHTPASASATCRG